MAKIDLTELRNLFQTVRQFNQITTLMERTKDAFRKAVKQVLELQFIQTEAFFRLAKF